MKTTLKRLVPDAYNFMRDFKLYGSRIIKNPEPLWPSFLLIGAPRCGTSFLYHYIDQHPKTEETHRKEIGFFDRNYDRGLKWYGWNLPVKTSESGICGDATPTYLSHPDCPERVKTFNPDLKLIVMLRNPVDRAFSSHAKNTKLGMETLDFENALEREQQAKRTQSALPNPAMEYLKRGLYADNLQAWFKHFPREQFLILKSEDVFENPEVNYEKVLAFLDLPMINGMNFKKINAATKSAMNEKTRAFLEEYYAAPNQALSDLLEGLQW